MKSIEVVAALIVRNSCVLGAQRGDVSGELSWEFPGGKIEKGETPEEALVREIDEELKVHIEVVRYVTTVKSSHDGVDITMKCYLAALANRKEPMRTEHLQLRWLDHSTIDSVPWLPADALVVKEIKAQGILE